MTAIPRITLKPGRDKSVRRRHPWIFSGAIADVSGHPESGETVHVCEHNGSLLGSGAYSPSSQIRVRMWSFDAKEKIDGDFIAGRLRDAIDMRQSLMSDTNAFRLVNAESDGLPGLVIDRYADFLVCQFTAAGVERWKNDIVSALAELAQCNGIYERSDGSDRDKEGLQTAVGSVNGFEPTDLIEIIENSCRFLVDIRKGQKTGFYLDQRDNRACIAQYSNNAHVLNCFSYTGGFGITALKAGASRIVNVDASSNTLDLLNENFKLNGLDLTKIANVQGDAFDVLREMGRKKELFDIVVLDPPKFVSSKDQLHAACRGYKDINMQGFKLVKPGGLLFTFSCSGMLDSALFSKIVADAALDARRQAQIIRRLGQAVDHPVLLSFPEGNYLKGLLCRCDAKSR